MPPPPEMERPEQKPDGGPAFPAFCQGEGHDGMTLRDWFAGQALAGLSADLGWDNTDELEIARASYAAADAMLEARKGEEGAPK